tara:strand:- start:342 stop:446 length:105 start_codon:yes stop_codon:yes gene_type:complete
LNPKDIESKISIYKLKTIASKNVNAWLGIAEVIK